MAEVHDYEDRFDLIEHEFGLIDPESAMHKNMELEENIKAQQRAEERQRMAARPASRTESVVLRDDTGLMIAIVTDGCVKTFVRDEEGHIINLIEEREI